MWTPFPFLFMLNHQWSAYLIDLLVQYSWTLWGLLEGTWLCQATMEEQAGDEGRGCRHCCFVWAGVLCLVLCWWDCRTRIYIHWLLCLSIAWRITNAITLITKCCIKENHLWIWINLMMLTIGYIFSVTWFS